MYNLSFQLITLNMHILRKTAEFGIRTLYSASALGIDNYTKTREKVKMQFHNMEDRFKTKMNEFSQPNSGNMIFTEDLKHIVHLVDSIDSDLDLVHRMMSKFSQQNKELRFGSFVFGPVVMRMYHYLNRPKEAIEVFKDPAVEGFFDQMASFQILMDLLFINEMYSDVLEVFDIIKSKQLQGSKYPKNCVVLSFAACYKLNNEKSFNYAKKLWSELNEVGHYPMRRAGTFAAALALAQHAPHIALEILTSMKQQTYVTVRNLKVVALADLGRPDDALPIMRSVLEYDVASDKKHTFSAEVLEKMQESVKRIGKKEVNEEYERIEKQLRTLGYVNYEPLNNLLCAEITASSKLYTKEKKSLQPNLYSRSRSSFHRPGLQDML